MDCKLFDLQNEYKLDRKHLLKMLHYLNISYFTYNNGTRFITNYDFEKFEKFYNSFKEYKSIYTFSKEQNITTTCIINLIEELNIKTECFWTKNRYISKIDQDKILNRIKSIDDIDYYIKTFKINNKSNCENFINKANQLYNCKYDYSNIKYINSKTKVEIICKEHGSFWMTPNNHLNGHECKYCTGHINWDINNLKERLKFMYDYDITNITFDNKTKIVNNLICKKHGSFSSNAYHLLNGHGCKQCGFDKCGLNRKNDLNYFISKSNKKHKNFYDYSISNYVGYDKPINIICPIHGVFTQRASNHMRGYGCNECFKIRISESLKWTKDEFVSKSINIHNDLYSYDNFVYINYNTPSYITCDKHGDFLQTPHSHLNGCGCPKCNSSKGELKIRSWLQEHNVAFEEQKRFDDCRDKNPLPFDFYIPSKNLCIEYDGYGHFGEMYKNGGKSKEKLQYIQNHDKIKSKYCEDNNINLLRIKYTEFDDVDFILSNCIC